MSGTSIHGTVEPGFESVREVFESGFDNGEIGAAVCAYLDGRKIIDLWGGWADAGRTRAWRHDTIVNTFSTTKGITATCALQLVDRGLLDLDEPVATYWPQFAQAGKATISVRMLLSHQAGLPTITASGYGDGVTLGSLPAGKLYDWDAATSALAKQSPIWEPGTRSEYHAWTFGFLVGQVVKYVDGRSLGRYFREEIAEPLGLDFMIGFGPEHDFRCAEVIGPVDQIGDTNSRDCRAAEVPSGNGHGTAESLARLYGALARGGELDGVQVLRAETIEAAAQEQALPAGEGVGDEPVGLGYQLLWKIFPGLIAPTFGHFGMGGSIGLADPATRLGFGYVMNQLPSGGAGALLVALYRSLGGSLGVA